MSKSRMQNVIMNLTSGFAYRILITVTSFIVRTVFIKCIDEVYLGVNGLFSNILSMLSLTELGFGTAMVYSMYKPLADGDMKTLSQLMRLYRKVYTIIGTVILVLRLGLIPFMDYLIKDKPDIEYLTVYYVMFLLNTVMSYWFFAYRTSILQADQKAYVLSGYNCVFNLIKSVLQIIMIAVFKLYFLYLATQILCTVAQNIFIAVRVKKEYPVFISDVPPLPKENKRSIFQDVKALMLQKISFTVLNSSDSLIISAFVGIGWVGLLSNYCMLEEAVTGVLCQITAALTASLGNYFAKENRDDGYVLFRRVDFLSFWLYGFSLVAMITLFNPFVTLWIGEDYLLSQAAVVALSVRFFVAGFMNTVSTFRSTLGLFTQGKYRPLLAAGLNILLSIILSYKFGIVGVLAATSITRLCVNMWYSAWIIHRDGFHKSVKKYYLDYLLRILLLAVVTVGVVFLSRLIIGEHVTVLSFILAMLLTAILPNAVFAAVFFRRDEFKYFVSLVKGLFGRIRTHFSGKAAN